MKLTLQGIQDPAYPKNGYILPAFDIQAVRQHTKERPAWIHFGAGNIMRAFPAVLCQRLLDAGQMDTGMIVVETYDPEIISQAFTPFDNLTLAVSLKSDGTVEKRVVASICESLSYQKHEQRVADLFCAHSLQMVTLTITEKGYAVTDGAGKPLDYCAGDFDSMEHPVSIIAILCQLMAARYQAGQKPIALVSLDNCSHNGTVLQNSILAIANAWAAKGLVDQGFVQYLSDPAKVSFPWSMIDKITPRPSEEVVALLEKEGFEDARIVVTAKNTYLSGMVNAEECEYLAIEDRFPGGRPSLEQVGVIFASRETVDQIEKMKVCTCLNPLHTCLAIFGCLLGFTKISDEMKDDALVALVRMIGYQEGLPVVVDPGIISARKFIDEVVGLRMPNPFVPDTPQRIACDTSQKLPVRFGETLKAYVAAGKTDLSFLKAIPLVFAGYARYLTGVNDEGVAFTPSPDPSLDALRVYVSGFVLGQPFDTRRLRPLFSDASICGVDLYAHGLGEVCERLFAAMAEGKGAIRKQIEACVHAPSP